MIHTMKNGVADISSIDLSKMDGFDKVSVIVVLEVAVISKLRNKYSDEDLNEEINFILDQKTFESKCILKYDEKIKIRSDVLEKLKKMSDLMENYSNLKPSQLKNIVKDILGISVLTTSNRRTFDKYIKSIIDCIYSCSGQRLAFHKSIDCSCFIRLVNEKLLEKHS